MFEVWKIEIRQLSIGVNLSDTLGNTVILRSPSQAQDKLRDEESLQ